jgi:hypothetical protein
MVKVIKQTKPASVRICITEEVKEKLRRMNTQEYADRLIADFHKDPSDVNMETNQGGR